MIDKIKAILTDPKNWETETREIVSDGNIIGALAITEVPKIDKVAKEIANKLKPPEILENELIGFVATYVKHNGNIPDEEDYHNPEKRQLVTRVLDTITDYQSQHEAEPPENLREAIRAEVCPSGQGACTVLRQDCEWACDDGCTYPAIDAILALFAGWKSKEEMNEATKRAYDEGVTDRLAIEDSLAAKLKEARDALAQAKAEGRREGINEIPFKRTIIGIERSLPFDTEIYFITKEELEAIKEKE